MTWFYRTCLRPALFAQDSEMIHDRTMGALAWASRRDVLCEALAAFYSAASLPIEAFGLRFENPIGLAAGMDKKAAAVPVWPSLGFGFCELGGITWHAQPGHPAPRLFRAVADGALVNRMGFNNPGAEAFAQTLARWRALGRWPRHPVGINLGKSKTTPLSQAAADYARSFRLLWAHADFFVVNVSSPNTPNLRQLQDKAALDEILAAMQQVNRQLSPVSAQPSVPTGGTGTGEDRPRTTEAKSILVKVAPDLSFEALDDILELVGPRGIAGLVATNTTLARPDASDAQLKRVYAEAGGLSGRPLRARSTEVVRHLFRQTRGRLPIIGVGGVFSADDAWEKIRAGATLVQVYTGLVFEGPGLARELVAGLRQRLREQGMRELREAIGTAA